MKKRLIKYGSIEQFRNIVSVMSRFDPRPRVDVTLTEKIHGTNGAVCFSEPLGLWVQSRNNIITPESDNAGCAAFIEERRDDFIRVFRRLSNIDGIDLNSEIITLYFEWCGENIQKNSCVSGLKKRAIFFDHYRVSGAEDIVSEHGTILNTYFLPLEPSDVNNIPDVYHVGNFKTWKIEIDFNRPAIAQNILTELVSEIESESPIGRHFTGEKRIGEGVVGTFFLENKLYRFKVKGDKHSATKVKKLRPADTEKEAKIARFVNEYACKPWRFEQAWQTVFGIDNSIHEPSVKFTGEFLRAVHADVLKEESDILAEMGLTAKDVNSAISKVARSWFNEQLDALAGLY